jgi:biopolymer transport protein ExbD
MKTRRRSDVQDVRLNMTPMIDVVFQLMIFFLVTLSKDDIVSHLDVNRLRGTDTATPAPLLQCAVYRDGFAFQGQRVDITELERQLGRIAAFDKAAALTVRCTSDSPHAALIQLLDRCAKSGLRNVSVFSQ